MKQNLFLHTLSLFLFSSIGLWIFFLGYFPLSLSPHKAPVSSHTAPSVPPLYDKLILVIIDALRYDFVLPPTSPMSFVTEMLHNGSARCFAAQAHAPTVTLPRIKALTTGTVPAFFDMITQISSPALRQDNLVSQLVAASRRIVFYGDDTWIKLFPDSFMRQDGTVSFFVNDFTEVDNNVTRHLPRELASRDWDVMILHYLGLDHIGHTYGSRSELITHKLREMDEILSRIFLELSSERSLLLALGDHGMSVTGSHGGATRDETMVPLLFMSSFFETNKYVPPNADDVIFQIDMTSTLSVLLGVRTPLESAGVVIPGMLSELSEQHQLLAMRNNIAHLCRLLEPPLREKYNCSNPNWGEVDLSQLVEEARSIQSVLLSTTSEYDHVYLYAGLFILGITLELTICILLRYAFGYRDFPTHKLKVRYCLLLIAVILFLVWAPLLIALFFVWVYLLTNELCYHQRFLRSLCVSTCWKQVLCWGSLLCPLLLFSSSCVEEEHYLWYYWLATFHFVLLISSLPNATAVTAVLSFALFVIPSKLLIALKQTGINWAYLSDVSQWLEAEGNDWFYLSLYSYSLFAICIINNAFLVRRASTHNKLLFIGSLLVILYFKLVIGEVTMTGELVPYSRGVWESWLVLSLAFILILSYTREFNILLGMFTGLQVVFLMLAKPYYSLILLATLTAFATVYPYILRRSERGYSLTLYAIWVCYATHYACGNSNHFASVDLGAGFKGMNSHYEPRASIQTYLSVFSMFFINLSFHFAHLKSDAIWPQIHLLLALRLYTLLTYLVTMHVFRYHLFVWSVFAPKFLYEVCHYINLAIVFGFVSAVRVKDILLNYWYK